MKIAIVNCFETYEQRVDLIRDFFVSNRQIVKVYCSDFRHFEKKKRVDSKQDYQFISTKPYAKNISVRRMYSHYNFSKRVITEVNRYSPDILYCLIPPNSLVHFASKYKDDHPECYLIFDIIDLWPETFPIRKFKNLPIFKWWKNLRDDNLAKANRIITECDLYQEVLSKAIKDTPTTTLYLAKDGTKFPENILFDEQIMHFCWLGSVNNIIDIDLIVRILEHILLSKPVVFHIIGSGENLEDFTNKLQKIGVKVENHGNVYDPEKKYEIIKICHFGMNIMKDSVCVGLTMKSIDYFEAGLPIINNIRGDTSRIVEIEKIGFNVINKNINELARSVVDISRDDLISMRKRTRMVFDKCFTNEVFFSNLEAIMKEGVVE